MACSLLCNLPYPCISQPGCHPRVWAYALLLTAFPPTSFPGLDRLPLPVSGFPRASRKTQHQ